MSVSDAGAVQLELLESVEGIEDPNPPPGLSSSTIVDQLEASGQWIKSLDSIRGRDLSWRPDLYSAEGSSVLYVHLADELRSYLKDRLRMAVECGNQVVLVLQLQALYQDDVVTFLGEIDADVMIVDPDEDSTTLEVDHILTVLSDMSVPVSDTTRAMLAHQAWDRRSAGNSYIKGRRFEGLVAFLLSQTIDFKVVERNLKSRTDEIDIVVQIQKHSDRCWQLEGSPLVLIEAKNWERPVDQEVVSVFHTKLTTKRQMARIGLLFSSNSFTSAATMQELKFAQDRSVIVMINGSQLVDWIDSNTPDDFLETLVRRAMLR